MDLYQLNELNNENKNMRWDRCKACNQELSELDLRIDPRQELCKECYASIEIDLIQKEYSNDPINEDFEDE